MNRREERANIAVRATAIVRDPYQMERALGVVLWVAFFMVLLSLGE